MAKAMQRRRQRRATKKAAMERFHATFRAEPGRPLNFVLRHLKAIGAPAVLLKLVTFIYSLTNVDPLLCYDQLEWMAGMHECTKACWERGRVGFPYEILHNPTYFDITGTVGFVTAIILTLKCKAVRGISPFAPVCSSWVPTNLFTSGRTRLRPQGHTCYKYVKDANLMVSRVALLMWLFAALALPFFVEQPKGSVMAKFHKRMKSTYGL